MRKRCLLGILKELINGLNLRHLRFSVLSLGGNRDIANLNNRLVDGFADSLEDCRWTVISFSESLLRRAFPFESRRDERREQIRRCKGTSLSSCPWSSSFLRTEILSDFIANRPFNEGMMRVSPEEWLTVGNSLEKTFSLELPHRRIFWGTIRIFDSKGYRSGRFYSL